uniref:Uncharacterized protein n=1 Tax=Mycena chlorophos TaxID=658473 RepID=A0ABQ0L8P7_MYCCL|nr:predicted protein [Mycena chlorophos]
MMARTASMTIKRNPRIQNIKGVSLQGSKMREGAQLGLCRRVSLLSTIYDESRGDLASSSFSLVSLSTLLEDASGTTRAGSGAIMAPCSALLRRVGVRRAAFILRRHLPDDKAHTGNSNTSKASTSSLISASPGYAMTASRIRIIRTLLARPRYVDHQSLDALGQRVATLKQKQKQSKAKQSKEARVDSSKHRDSSTTYVPRLRLGRVDTFPRPEHERRSPTRVDVDSSKAKSKQRQSRNNVSSHREKTRNQRRGPVPWAAHGDQEVTWVWPA